MLDLLSIHYDALYVNIIGEYLDDNDCKTYLKSMDTLDKFGYLCMEYKNDNELINVPRNTNIKSKQKIYKRQIKYLSNKLNNDDIHEYTNLETLRFDNYYNDELLPGTLCNGLNKLMFGICFDQILYPGVIPKSTKEVYIGWNYNQPFIQGSFNEGLKTLVLSGFFEKKLEPEVIPNSVETLIISARMGTEIKNNVLPLYLKKLILSGFINFSPDVVLPEFLEHFTIKGNVTLPNKLPISLKTLIINQCGYSVRGLKRLYPDIKVIKEEY